MASRKIADDLKDDRLLTAAEAAEFLGVKKSTIRQWTYQRRIPCVRLLNSRAVRYRRSRLLKVIEAGEQPTLVN
jgi:excisionase family DNA binding protein